MPFKKKSFLKVGPNKNIIIPRPPTHATHVHINVGSKKAVVPVRDFDVLYGVDGWFHFIRKDKKGKVIQKYDGEWYWNGRNVEGIEDLIKDDKD